MRKYLALGLLAALLATIGCTGYQYKPVPFKAADAYPNNVRLFGAVIAAKAWTDNQEARSAFGFDIRGAGLTPVQVIVDNQGDNALTIVPDQTMIKDTEGNMWNLLPAQVAYERIDKQVALDRMGGNAVRQGGLGAAAGAILGAAIGVVTGGDVAEAAMRGAAAGAAVGTVKGGYEGLEDRRSKDLIAKDLQSRGLKDKPMKPKEISHGFLFFPGEVLQATVLRLKLKNLTTGQMEILLMNVSR